MILSKLAPTTCLSEASLTHLVAHSLTHLLNLIKVDGKGAKKKGLSLLSLIVIKV